MKVGDIVRARPHYFLGDEHHKARSEINLRMGLVIDVRTYDESTGAWTNQNRSPPRWVHVYWPKLEKAMWAPASTLMKEDE